jgi:hypothetical protein
MTDSAPAPFPLSTAFGLYFLQNGKHFFWRNPNHGVTLIDAGRESAIAWHNENEAIRRLWTDIVSVNMMSTTGGKDIVNSCRINFRNSHFLVVTDAGTTGEVDHDRTPVYRDCIRALHLRLAQAPAGTIAFSAGASEGRHKVVTVMGAVAALFFVGTPLVLVFVVRDWRMLLTLAAGATFVWPFWNVIDAPTGRAATTRAFRRVS